MARAAKLYSALPAGLLLTGAALFAYAGWAAVTVPVDISPLVQEKGEGAWTPSRPEGHEIAFQPKPLENYKLLLERPVFNKDRKPYKKPPPPPPKPEPVKKKKPPPPPAPPVKLALEGVIMFEGQQMALIRKEGDEDSRPIGMGEKIAGWQVEKVSGNHVVLIKDGKTRDLRLYVD